MDTMKEDKTPKVTILVPTRNRLQLLSNVVEAVLNQTYENLQIIICDNNSIDGTREFLEKIKDPRFLVLRSETDLPMSENWSRGLMHVSGEYFIRFDDDNFYAPELIQKGIDLFDCYQSTAVVAFCNLETRHDDVVLGSFDPGEVVELTPENFLYLNHLCFLDSNYILYKHSIIEQICGKEFYRLDDLVPDRRLNNELAFSGLGCVLDTTPMGVARYDFRPRHQNKENFGFLKILLLKMEGLEGLSIDDCHKYFGVCRQKTLRSIANRYPQSSIYKKIARKVGGISDKDYLCASKVMMIFEEDISKFPKKLAFFLSGLLLSANVLIHRVSFDGVGGARLSFSLMTRVLARIFEIKRGVNHSIGKYQDLVLGDLKILCRPRYGKIKIFLKNNFS